MPAEQEHLPSRQRHSSALAAEQHQEAPPPTRGGGAFSRGDRISFRDAGGEVIEAEVVRVSPDGRLVVAPLRPGSQRLLLAVELVVAHTPR